MPHDTSDIIQRHTLFPLSTGHSYDLTDAFALAWIFSATLAAGLMLLGVNLVSMVSVAFSLSLGIIWWVLTHVRRRRRR